MTTSALSVWTNASSGRLSWESAQAVTTQVR